MNNQKEITKESLQTLIDNKLFDVAQNLIELHKLKYKITDNGQLVEASAGAELWLERYLTQDTDSLELKKDVLKLANLPYPVLITGETGTGKEIIARALHGDREGKFVPINCGGLPEHLIESELFGHVKGAFTGADSAKEGLMKTAENGTLFLDEIGELPLQVQAKLLRSLQEKTIRMVGGNAEHQINCRIVCATNVDIMNDKSSFRRDLLARISTFTLYTKPLNDRIGDIKLILESTKEGQKVIKDGHLSTLEGFHYTMNVRSLQHYVTRYSVLGKF